MALFFDARWFDDRLSSRGLDRSALGAAAGLDPETLALMFKDQREVAPHEVRAFAALLGEADEEVARRCGVTTRTAPPRPATDRRLDALEAQLTRMEAKLDALLAALRQT